MKSFLKSIGCLVFILFISCEGDVLPKPNAFLRLEYQMPTYFPLQEDCPYTFQKNTISNLVTTRKSCWINLEYPSMNGTIHISYRPVSNDLEKLLKDAQKLTYEHVAKADGIKPTVYENKERNVYGMVYEVEGNAASQVQFYATDSTKHFLTGSLYFNTKPNYDSIYPAAVYLKKDIRTIIESLEWKTSAIKK